MITAIEPQLRSNVTEFRLVIILLKTLIKKIPQLGIKWRLAKSEMLKFMQRTIDSFCAA